MLTALGSIHLFARAVPYCAAAGSEEPHSDALNCQPASSMTGWLGDAARYLCAGLMPRDNPTRTTRGCENPSHVFGLTGFHLRGRSKMKVSSHFQDQGLEVMLVIPGTQQHQI